MLFYRNVSANNGADGYRLPTSMEWELAARYIDGYRWTPGNFASGANGPSDNQSANSVVAWYNSTSNNSTHPVGMKAPNALGIYDMSGNVREWCFDWYPGFFGSSRVDRGGSWGSDGDILRVSSLDGSAYSSGGRGFGFRLVKTL